MSKASPARQLLEWNFKAKTIQNRLLKPLIKDLVEVEKLREAGQKILVPLSWPRLLQVLDVLLQFVPVQDFRDSSRLPKPTQFIEWLEQLGYSVAGRSPRGNIQSALRVIAKRRVEALGKLGVTVTVEKREIDTGRLPGFISDQADAAGKRREGERIRTPSSTSTTT